MIGHLVACYGAADRYLGMLAATLGECRARRGALRARAWSSTGAWARATWLAHTAYEYARLLLARGPASATGREALLGEAAALAERIGMPALLGRIRALGLRRAADRPARRALGPRGRRSWASSPRASATARSARRCSSASTPPPTTSAASCARPAAPIAPRPPPTPTGTAWSRHSGPRYDLQHAALRDRADLRRAARPHQRRRQADRRDQRRRGRPLALLVPERGPAAHLLPLRGALAGRDHRRRASGRTSRRTRSSRSARPTLELSGRLRDWAASQADA